MTAFLVWAARLFGRPIKLSAVDPISHALERQEREARRRHQAVRHIRSAKTDRLHAALRGRA